eukprot:12899073-Prorocentrum_lima.AAC.1
MPSNTKHNGDYSESDFPPEEDFYEANSPVVEAEDSIASVGNHDISHIEYGHLIVGYSSLDRTFLLQRRPKH